MELTDDMIIPRFLGGRPLYMGGVPVRPENHMIEGISVKDLYYSKYCVDKKLTDFEMKALKDYIIYYYHAPIWANEELKRGDMADMDVDELLNLGMEYGVDPL
jgi:hypothetical protein